MNNESELKSISIITCLLTSRFRMILIKINSELFIVFLFLLNEKN